jgi:hypothetical protein
MSLEGDCHELHTQFQYKLISNLEGPKIPLKSSLLIRYEKVACDIMNIDPLLNRLRKVGLPSNVIDLIEVWQQNRMYYFSVDEVYSLVYDLLLGTVHGSILAQLFCHLCGTIIQH